MALVCGQFQQANRFAFVLRQAASPFLMENPECGLRRRIALIGRKPMQPHGFYLKLRKSSETVLIKQRQ